jgi:hypothetical protein
MGAGSSTQFTSNGNELIAPQLTDSGIGEYVGKGIGTVGGGAIGSSVGTALTGNPTASLVGGAIGADIGQQYGGQVGKSVESIATGTFYAQERLYTDIYNEERKNGSSHSDAKFWADVFKPSEN